MMDLAEYMALMQLIQAQYQQEPQQQNQQQQGQQGQQQQDPQQMYDMYKKFSGGNTTPVMNPGASSQYASNAGMYGPSGTYGEGFASASGGGGGTAGGGVGGGETAGGMGGGTAAAIAAVIAAQMLATKFTDRRAGDKPQHTTSRAEGHRTGNVFSMDFFTEPWQAYAYQTLGVDTLTPGEKTDAAVDRFRNDEGGLMDVAKTAPGTAAQWFDPTGSVIYDLMDDKFGTVGKIASKAVFPLQWLGRLFS